MALEDSLFRISSAESSVSLLALVRETGFDSAATLWPPNRLVLFQAASVVWLLLVSPVSAVPVRTFYWQRSPPD